eukprot:CAMPEP_0170486822 /NCGR_PEP_ID=MMETSP0208-20121228/5755_1 /TAXON_ID=197538 /ORGANISM="Strombidium inclinatum, Strain S3" /LENGTH=42 /DNA_ID= /DNA_START= /DNA_END= /DNA_ORIENTATION=
MIVYCDFKMKSFSLTLLNMMIGRMKGSRIVLIGKKEVVIPPR